MDRRGNVLSGVSPTSKAREIARLAIDGLEHIIQSCDGDTFHIAELAEDLKAQIEAMTPRAWKAFVLPDGGITSTVTAGNGEFEIVEVEEC